MEETPNQVESGEYMEAAAPEGLDQTTQEVSQGQVQESQQQSVPLSALQAERENRQKLEEDMRMLKDHMALMQNQGQTQAKQEPSDGFDGLADDDDILTVKDFKKAIGKLSNQYQMSLQELKMTQKHPDYQEVVTKYLPSVLKNNPSLRRSLEATKDYELAYFLARNSDEFKAQTKSQKKNETAQKMIANSKKTNSLSSVGTPSPMSIAKRYSQMSDSDFRTLANRNMY